MCTAVTIDMRARSLGIGDLREAAAGSLCPSIGWSVLATAGVSTQVAWTIRELLSRRSLVTTTLVTTTLVTTTWSRPPGHDHPGHDHPPTITHRPTDQPTGSHRPSNRTKFRATPIAPRRNARTTGQLLGRPST